MNLQNRQLSELVILWHASDQNLLLKRKIETELQSRIKINTIYSREYFFKICKVNNHSINVFFIPTSKAYKSYGPNLLINEIILSDEEMHEIISNYFSIPQIKSSGIIKVKILNKDNLSSEFIFMAANVGFHTSEIFELLHL